MAYCNSCGAYIPDGTSVCLACGYDEAAEKASSATATARRPGHSQKADDLRDVMDRHRRLQQEKNRQWAESERARREKQAEDRRWAEEEYAKRQAARELEEEQRRRADEERRRAEARRREEEARIRREAEERQRMERSMGNSSSKVGNSSAILAALSYFSVCFVLPFLLTPDDGFARFHAKQGLRLFILGAIADILSVTPIGWILQVFRVYCIIKGIVNALNLKRERLPYIGNIGKD